MFYKIDDTNSRINVRDGDLDRYIGERLRLRRSALGMSQSKLGKMLGVTFQQIQKYEKGANRISASTLHGMTSVLDVGYSYFFDGFGTNAAKDDSTPTYEKDNSRNKESVALLKAYYKISDPNVRKKIADLIRAFSQSEKSQPDEEK